MLWYSSAFHTGSASELKGAVIDTSLYASLKSLILMFSLQIFLDVVLLWICGLGQRIGSFKSFLLWLPNTKVQCEASSIY